MDQETLKTILVIPAGVIFVGLFVFVMSCFDMSVFDEAEKQARQKARERRRQENERLWQMEEQKRAKQKAQELEQKRKNILSHEDFYAQGITGDLIKLETLAVEVVYCVIKQPRVHFYLAKNAIEISSIDIKKLYEDQFNYIKTGYDIRNQPSNMHPDYTLVPAEFAKLIRWLRQSCCKPVKPKPIKPQPKTLTEEASDLMQSYRVLVEEATKTIVDEGLRQDALDTLGVAFRTKMEDLYRKDRQ